MANDWLDKAKAAALNIAKDAQAAAKAANLGELVDKTKAMAVQAADTVMAKTGAVPAAPVNTMDDCSARLVKVNAMLTDIKALLNKQQTGEVKPETKENCKSSVAAIEAVITELKDLLNK